MTLTVAQTNVLLAAWPTSGLPQKRIAQLAGLAPIDAGSTINACIRRGWMTVTETGGLVTTAKGRRKVG